MAKLIRREQIEPVVTDSTITGDGTTASPLSAPGGGSGGTALTDGTTINGDGTAGDRIRLDPDVQADIAARLATVNKLSEFATMQDKRDALTNLGLTKIRGGTF